MSGLTFFGLVGVTAMLVCYALESVRGSCSGSRWLARGRQRTGSCRVPGHLGSWRRSGPSWRFIDERLYATVGGYVLGRIGQRPSVGDRVELEGRVLRVEALDGARVAWVNLSTPS